MSSRNGTKVITGEVRFSYLHVFEPYAGEVGQKPKYSVSLLIPKKDKQTIALIQEAVAEAKKLGVERGNWSKESEPKNLKLPLRDGDEEKADEHPEYAGMYFINASSTRQPGLVDRHKQNIFSDQELKSGDWGIASINFYPFSVSGNRGIACGLNNLMKKRDGESLGGTPASAEADFAEEFDDDGMLD